VLHLTYNLHFAIGLVDSFEFRYGLSSWQMEAGRVPIVSGPIGPIVPVAFVLEQKDSCARARALFVLAKVPASDQESG
jgi:hypothetical protein